MNDDLKQLDFALVDDAFDRIFRAEQSQRLKEASPPLQYRETWEDTGYDVT